MHQRNTQGATHCTTEDARKGTHGKTPKTKDKDTQKQYHSRNESWARKEIVAVIVITATAGVIATAVESRPWNEQLELGI